MAVLEVSDDIRAGAIAIPHGWGYQGHGVGWWVAAQLPGATVNLLHDPALTDTFSGSPSPYRNLRTIQNWVARAGIRPPTETASRR
ncbi:hypothetical protein GCM10023318_21100 [Nocardia callitridis]|uniref:Uncharacterized protein n=1 Tax=Nocardia callitridis TaxID=648753 RepID=A0ABP9K6P3_9NOCA